MTLKDNINRVEDIRRGKSGLVYVNSVQYFLFLSQLLLVEVIFDSASREPLAAQVKSIAYS